jgi:hypothetical protein
MGGKGDMDTRSLILLMYQMVVFIGEPTVPILGSPTLSRSRV